MFGQRGDRLMLSREEVREVISKMKNASHARGVPVNRKVNGHSITYYPRSAGNGWESTFQISGGHLYERERIAEREIDSFVTKYATVDVWGTQKA
jgi:hypothetical protein